MSNNTFEKWQDALPYIGKQVGVRVVESPDIKGMLTGFDFTLNDKTEEVDKVYLKLADHHAKFEFWECYPVEEILKHIPENIKFRPVYKFVAIMMGIAYLLLIITCLISK